MLQIILQHIFSDELEEADGTQTVVPRHELMNIVSVTQLEKDTILVCHDNMVKVRIVYIYCFGFCLLLYYVSAGRQLTREAEVLQASSQ